MSVTAGEAEARLAEAAEACRIKLLSDSCQAALVRLGPLAEPQAAFAFLSGITADLTSGGQLAELARIRDGEAERNALEQTLLVLAAQHAANLVPSLPIGNSVKAGFAEEFLFFASPPPAWLSRFQTDDVRFREMIRVATLRRFPAGQFQWEISAFPRSGILKAGAPIKLLLHFALRMRGFGPLFELHLNERRRNRMILLEKESNLSYHKAARALELQPRVRGLMLASWLFCRTTARITPRLAWLRETPESEGALIVDLGDAPPDSGFLVGSEERRALYEKGEYRPKLACILWPREAVLRWAARHPEFDS